MESIVCNKQINIIYKNESIVNLEIRFDKGCSILYVVNENGQYLGCVTRKDEYYVAAGPPVRRGESHPSGQTEPPCY